MWGEWHQNVTPQRSRSPAPARLVYGARALQSVSGTINRAYWCWRARALRRQGGRTRFRGYPAYYACIVYVIFWTESSVCVCGTGWASEFSMTLQPVPSARVLLTLLVTIMSAVVATMTEYLVMTPSVMQSFLLL